jgi:uncharacterized protein
VPIIDCYTLLGSWPESEVELSVEALAAGMQARGVGRSLVTHTNAVLYDMTMGNDEVLQLSKQHSQLTPVAVVNPLDYPDCLDEVNRCLDQGVQVFRLCPREHGYPFSSEVGPLRAVLGRLERAKLLLVDLVGLPAPVLSADLPALLPIPTAVSVQSRALGTVIQASEQGENLWLETSRLDAGGVLEAAVKHLGSARIVFGSAAPLYTLGSAVMSVQYAELAEADRTAIFEGNAQRVLGN